MATKGFLKKTLVSALVASQVLSALPVSTPFGSNLGTQNSYATSITDLGQFGEKIYVFKDEEDLKYKIFSDPEFIKSYATLAHKLGFGWCGGTKSQYVGEDFSVMKQGDDYTIKANYNSNDPYASGYWADKRLSMKVSNIRFYMNPETLQMGKGKVTETKEMAAGSFNLDNHDRTSTDKVTSGITYQIATMGSHATTYKFTEALGLKQSFKQKVTVPLFAETESTTEFSFNFTAEQGWTDTESTTKTTTLSTSYTGDVPPQSRRPVQLIALTNKSEVPYSADIYVEYTLTLSGFMRWGGNARTDHPTNRPWEDFTLGKVDGNGNIVKSAAEDLFDQFDHKDIPGYSKWDWNQVLRESGYSNGQTPWFIGDSVKVRGGELNGVFRFDTASTVNIAAYEPIPIPGINTVSTRAKRSVEALEANSNQESVVVNDFIDNKLPQVKILGVTATSESSSVVEPQPTEPPKPVEPSNPTEQPQPTVQVIPQNQMNAVASDEETVFGNDVASNVLDGNTASMWHTKWYDAVTLPQSVTLDLGGNYDVSKVACLPRQDACENGHVLAYNIYVSEDGVNFTKVTEGTWANDKAEKFAEFASTSARYVKIEATQGNGGWASIAEINVFGIQK